MRRYPRIPVLMIFTLAVLFAAEFGCGGSGGGSTTVFLPTGTGTGGTIPG